MVIDFLEKVFAEASTREAIIFHLEGLREDGLPVPPGESTVDYVDVAV